MTEQRKIQLATEVDASGAAQGFERIKQGARDMAQSVTQAGQQAGKGLDAIADGAKRGADGLTREETRIRSAIQRATLEIASIGKTASQKIEINAQIKDIDISKLEPQLAVLRQLEAEQARAAAGAKGQAFIGDLQAQLAQLREQAHLQSLSADEALRYKAAQAGVAEAAAPLITELRSIQQAQEAVANAARSAAAAQKEAAVQANTRSSFLASLKQESDAIGKSRADLLAMRAAELGVAEAAGPMIAKIKEADAAHRGLAASGKLSAFQQQQLGFQLHDFAVQVASGQSAITAFVQQGSQLSGTFGGAGNAFKAILSTITPMKLAIAGTAVAIGGLGLAMASAESRARELATVQAQLFGTGRADLFSTKELKDYITQLALLPGVSREAATGIVSELSKVHEIGGIFKDIGTLAADFAATTGQKLPEATKQLAKAFADPAKGAKELEAALGTLTAAQLLQIERLQRVGDFAGAQRALRDALDSIKGAAATSFTPLGKSIDDLSKAWGNLQKAFGESDGLRVMLGLLAKGIDLVTGMVNGAAKLTSLPSKLAIEGGNAVRRAIGLPEVTPQEVAEARARVFGPEPAKDAAAARGANNQAMGEEAKAANDVIKRALEAGKAYKSEAQQIKELKETREGFNKALQESIALDRKENGGKASDVTKQLRGNIAGVNERIASIQKKGLGPKSNEAEQVAIAQAKADEKQIQELLDRRKDAIAFAEQYLQGAYQAGAISLKAYFDQRRELTAAGVDGEIATLEEKRERLVKLLANPAVKDPSKRVEIQGQITDINEQEARLRQRAGFEIERTNQQEAETFRQLSEQVQNYRANLLQMQGDEAGAAKIRAQVAIQQASILAKQSQGTKNPITAADEKANADAIQQTNDIAAARTRLGLVTQDLSLQEERIAMLQRTGAIGELEALDRLGAARSARLGQLQKEVDELEKLSQLRPADLQLKLDASRARLELDSFKAQLDPLKQRFDGIFKDAGANLFSDLANGTKPLQAIKNFANSIQREISGVVGRQLSEQLFGDGGAFGGLGKAAADLFGSKKRGVSLDTSGAEQSLNNLRAAGVDPATTALQALTEAAQATAVELRNVTGTDLPPIGSATGLDSRFPQNDLPQADGTGATGDFARFDRVQQKATDATAEGEKADRRAAGAVSQLANAALRGSSALSSLPAILSSISSAAGYSNPGALIGAGLNAIFGGSGAAAVSNTAFGSTTFADALSAGVIPLSKGGYTGDVDVRQAAGVVHGREFVFSAPATAAIGRDRLERAHEAAKAGNGNALASIVTNNLYAGKPGYMLGGFVTGPGAAPTRPELSLSSMLGGFGTPAAGPASVVPAASASQPPAALTFPDIQLPGFAELSAKPAPTQAATWAPPPAGGFSIQPALHALASLQISPLEVARGILTMAAAPSQEAVGPVGAPPTGISGVLQQVFALRPADGAREQASSLPEVFGMGLLDMVLGRSRGTREAEQAPRASGSTVVADPTSVLAQARNLLPFSTGGYTGDVDPRSVAGVVHGKEYVFSAEATAAIGVGRLERLHRMAKTGQTEGHGLRGYAEGGYVTIPGDRLQTLGSVQYLVPPQQQPAKTGDTYVETHHNNITVQAAPGMTRATAMQRGAEVGQGISMSLRRQGKRR